METISDSQYKALPRKEMVTGIVVWETTIRGNIKPEAVREVFSAVNLKPLRAEGKRMAMVGDGVADVLARAQADVGIAIGSGADVAKETSHVIFKRDMRDVVVAVGIARVTLRRRALRSFLQAGSESGIDGSWPVYRASCGLFRDLYGKGL